MLGDCAYVTCVLCGLKDDGDALEVTWAGGLKDDAVCGCCDWFIDCTDVERSKADGLTLCSSYAAMSAGDAPFGRLELLFVSHSPAAAAADTAVCAKLATVPAPESTLLQLAALLL